MKRRGLIIVFLIVFVLIFFNYCNKSNVSKDNISLTVKLSTPYYSDIMTDIIYNWKIKKIPFNFDPDYKVFVHFWWNSKKVMLFQDDHNIPWNIENWKNGEKLTYTHKEIYIPDFLDDFDLDLSGKEKITITAGLYKPNVKDSKLILFSKEIEFEPRPAEYPEITFAEGWYPEENFGRGIFNSWRWTAKDASIIADNIGQDLKLYIIGGVDKGIYPDQKIIIKINDKQIDEFIPENGKFRKNYLLKKTDLGENDEFTILISTDKTFTPSKIKHNDDNRELGLQIFLVNLMPAK
jgi:hypothetical protein